MSLASLTALADKHSWVSGKNGNFSVAENWTVTDVGNVAPVEGDDINFWRNAETAGTWLYVTNDLPSVSFGTVNFSAGLLDVAGDIKMQDSKHLYVASSPSTPLAVVNKRSGNWTIGQDLYIATSGSTDITGVMTNNAGNINAGSGWIYIGGNTTGANLPRVIGSLVVNSGTVTTKAMILGGRANGTSGTLEMNGGTVTISNWVKLDSEWCGIFMCGWGGAKGFLKVGRGATLNLTSSGANIGVGDGTAVISIDGTVKLTTEGKVLSTATSSKQGINFTIGSSGRLECKYVNLRRSTNPSLVLDGGTFAPNGTEATALHWLHLKVTSKNGVYEVPSGKTINTGVYVSDYSDSNKGRLIKTGAGTLNINNWFRPSGGLRVNAGTAQITHNGDSFASFNYPMSISKTGTVTSGAFVMGSGGTLEFEHASKTSGATMNITTSFTRNADIPITFSTEDVFGFDDTYTLVKGGKIANTNNFHIASATANDVDITSSVYLAVSSGNLVLKRKPYFTIKVR